jgi:hypothetical protein
VAARNEDLRQQPVGDVASQLMRDVSLLVRQEVELAKEEMREKGRTLLPGLGMLGGATLVALYAAGAATAFLVLVFSLFLDAWAAALVVALALAAIAAVLGALGKDRVADAGPPIPEQTIESVKEDAQWVKEQARSGRT